MVISFPASSNGVKYGHSIGHKIISINGPKCGLLLYSHKRMPLNFNTSRVRALRALSDDYRSNTALPRRSSRVEPTLIIRLQAEFSRVWHQVSVMKNNGIYAGTMPYPQDFSVTTRIQEFQALMKRHNSACNLIFSVVTAWSPVVNKECYEKNNELVQKDENNGVYTVRAHALRWTIFLNWRWR